MRAIVVLLLVTYATLITSQLSVNQFQDEIYKEAIKNDENHLTKRFISFKPFIPFIPNFRTDLSFNKMLDKFKGGMGYMGMDTSGLTTVQNMYNSAFATRNLLFKRRCLNLIIRICNFIMSYLPEEPVEVNPQLYQLNKIIGGGNINRNQLKAAAYVTQKPLDRSSIVIQGPTKIYLSDVHFQQPQELDLSDKDSDGNNRDDITAQPNKEEIDLTTKPTVESNPAPINNNSTLFLSGLAAKPNDTVNLDNKSGVVPNNTLFLSGLANNPKEENPLFVSGEVENKPYKKQSEVAPNNTLFLSGLGNPNKDASNNLKPYPKASTNIDNRNTDSKLFLSTEASTTVKPFNSVQIDSKIGDALNKEPEKEINETDVLAEEISHNLKVIEEESQDLGNNSVLLKNIFGNPPEINDASKQSVELVSKFGGASTDEVSTNSTNINPPEQPTEPQNHLKIVKRSGNIDDNEYFDLLDDDESFVLVLPNNHERNIRSVSDDSLMQNHLNETNKFVDASIVTSNTIQLAKFNDSTTPDFLITTNTKPMDFGDASITNLDEITIHFDTMIHPNNKNSSNTIGDASNPKFILAESIGNNFGNASLDLKISTLNLNEMANKKQGVLSQNTNQRVTKFNGASIVPRKNIENVSMTNLEELQNTNNARYVILKNASNLETINSSPLMQISSTANISTNHFVGASSTNSTSSFVKASRPIKFADAFIHSSLSSLQDASTENLETNSSHLEDVSRKLTNSNFALNFDNALMQNLNPQEHNNLENASNFNPTKVDDVLSNLGLQTTLPSFTNLEDATTSNLSNLTGLENVAANLEPQLTSNLTNEDASNQNLILQHYALSLNFTNNSKNVKLDSLINSTNLDDVLDIKEQKLEDALEMRISNNPSNGVLIQSSINSDIIHVNEALIQQITNASTEQQSNASFTNFETSVTNAKIADASIPNHNNNSSRLVYASLQNVSNNSTNEEILKKINHKENEKNSSMGALVNYENTSTSTHVKEALAQQLTNALIEEQSNASIEIQSNVTVEHQSNVTAKKQSNSSNLETFTNKTVTNKKSSKLEDASSSNDSTIAEIVKINNEENEEITANLNFPHFGEKILSYKETKLKKEDNDVLLIFPEGYTKEEIVELTDELTGIDNPNLEEFGATKEIEAHIRKNNSNLLDNSEDLEAQENINVIVSEEIPIEIEDNRIVSASIEEFSNEEIASKNLEAKHSSKFRNNFRNQFGNNQHKSFNSKKNNLQTDQFFAQMKKPRVWSRFRQIKNNSNNDKSNTEKLIKVKVIKEKLTKKTSIEEPSSEEKSIEEHNSNKDKSNNFLEIKLNHKFSLSKNNSNEELSSNNTNNEIEQSKTLNTEETLSQSNSNVAHLFSITFDPDKETEIRSSEATTMKKLSNVSSVMNSILMNIERAKKFNNGKKSKYALVVINKKLLPKGIDEMKTRPKRFLGTARFSAVTQRFRELAPNFQGFTNHVYFPVRLQNFRSRCNYYRKNHFEVNQNRWNYNAVNHQHHFGYNSRNYNGVTKETTIKQDEKIEENFENAENNFNHAEHFGENEEEEQETVKEKIESNSFNYLPFYERNESYLNKDVVPIQKNSQETNKNVETESQNFNYLPHYERKTDDHHQKSVHEEQKKNKNEETESLKFLPQFEKKEDYQSQNIVEVVNQNKKTNEKTNLENESFNYLPYYAKKVEYNTEKIENVEKNDEEIDINKETEKQSFNFLPQFERIQSYQNLNIEANNEKIKKNEEIRKNEKIKKNQEIWKNEEIIKYEEIKKIEEIAKNEESFKYSYFPQYEGKRYQTQTSVGNNNQEIAENNKNEKLIKQYFSYDQINENNHKVNNNEENIKNKAKLNHFEPYHRNEDIQNFFETSRNREINKNKESEIPNFTFPQHKRTQNLENIKKFFELTKKEENIKRNPSLSQINQNNPSPIANTELNKVEEHGFNYLPLYETKQIFISEESKSNSKNSEKSMHDTILAINAENFRKFQTTKKPATNFEVYNQFKVLPYFENQRNFVNGNSEKKQLNSAKHKESAYLFVFNSGEYKPIEETNFVNLNLNKVNSNQIHFEEDLNNQQNEKIKEQNNRQPINDKYEKFVNQLEKNKEAAMINFEDNDEENFEPFVIKPIDIANAFNKENSKNEENLQKPNQEIYFEEYDGHIKNRHDDGFRGGEEETKSNKFEENFNQANFNHKILENNAEEQNNIRENINQFFIKPNQDNFKTKIEAQTEVIPTVGTSSQRPIDIKYEEFLKQLKKDGEKIESNVYYTVLKPKNNEEENIQNSNQLLTNPIKPDKAITNLNQYNANQFLIKSSIASNPTETFGHPALQGSQFFLDTRLKENLNKMESAPISTFEKYAATTPKPINLIKTNYLEFPRFEIKSNLNSNFPPIIEAPEKYEKLTNPIKQNLEQFQHNNNEQIKLNQHFETSHAPFGLTKNDERLINYSKDQHANTVDIDPNQYDFKALPTYQEGNFSKEQMYTKNDEISDTIVQYLGIKNLSGAEIAKPKLEKNVNNIIKSENVNINEAGVVVRNNFNGEFNSGLSNNAPRRGDIINSSDEYLSLDEDSVSFVNPDSIDYSYYNGDFGERLK